MLNHPCLGRIDDAIQIQVGPRYHCPDWMENVLCERLEMTCANGICEDHENCKTCAFDCGCGGAEFCNMRTGQCHSPAGVCMGGDGVMDLEELKRSLMSP